MLFHYLKRYPFVIVCFLYLAITLLFTYPLVTVMQTRIPQSGSDAYQAFANIDTTVATFRSLGLKAGALSIIRGLNTFTPYVLLTLVLGKIIAYNGLFLLSYLLSAIGMYLLAFYFTKNRSAAFLAGLIYAFAPFHYYQSVAVHLGTMHQEWLPFFALYLFRFFERFEFRYFFGTAIFGALIAIAEHQLLAFTVLFIVTFLVFQIWTNPSFLKNKNFWISAGGSLALGSILLFGMFGYLLDIATSGNNYLNAGENAANRYSMHLLDPFAPPAFHALWPRVGAFLQRILVGSEGRGSYFLGYSVLFVIGYLVFISLRRFREKRFPVSRTDSIMLFWAGTTVLFFVFSLGTAFTLFGQTIPLPYAIIYKYLPFYENIRTTGRYFVYALLGSVLLFAYGFDLLTATYREKRRLLILLFAGLILMEFWVGPIRTMAIEHSSFFERLARDSERYSLIEIPGSTSYEFASYSLYTDTIHRKTVVNGIALARKITGQFDWQQRTPIIKQLLYTLPKGNDPDQKDTTDILRKFDYSQANAILSYYGVRYITISKPYTKGVVRTMTEGFIEKHITTVTRYEDDFLIAYELPTVIPTGMYADLDTDDNQYSNKFIDQDGLLKREIGDGSGLSIVNLSAEPQKATIVVEAQSARPLSFGCTVGQRLIEERVLLTGTIRRIACDVVLQSGENMIGFSLTDQDGVVVKRPDKAKPTFQTALVSHIEIMTEN